jgi:hypothetical protein
MINGKVTDGLTGLPLSSCSVYSLESGKGSVTDDKGKYMLQLDRKTDSVAVSMVGYETIKKSVTKADEQEIDFVLMPVSSSMEGVVIKFKAKYTLAQMLIRKVIKNKNTNDVFNAESYQCQVYDKIEVDAKNIPQGLQTSRFTKPLAFALQNMDTTKDNDLALPIFITESSSNFYFQKKPEKKRYDYTAIKSSGVDNKSFLKYVDGLYKNINVYDNNVKLADVNFVSPISDNALTYYNYNILDTLVIDNHSCIQVKFDPKNDGSNTFHGYLWIKDTSYAVKSLVMRIYKNANVNFIKKLEISQVFEYSNYGKFLPERSELYIDLLLPQFKKFGAIVKKTTLFRNAFLNDSRIDTAFDKKPVDLSSMTKDTANWATKRFEPLSTSEQSIYKLIDSLQKVPLAIFYEKLISAITTGYYTTGNVDIGNIYNFYTNNRTEGNRFNFGLQTNPGFNRHIQLSGYLGYSTKINQTSYMASSKFVLTRKQWSTLTLKYMNDITGSYDYSKYAPDETSIFSLSAILQRTNANPLRLVNNKGGNIAYRKYFNNGIGIGAEINHQAITPYFNTYFTHDGFTPYLYSKPGVNNDYLVNEATVSLRYAYREKYVTQNYVRGSLGSVLPIVTFAFTKGIKINRGALKSDFNYHKWDIDIQQNITFGRIGKLTYNIDAGVVNGILPIIFLDIPRGNYTYYYDVFAFNNMNRYEFATDKYLSLMVQQGFGSFPFKYIPLLKKTRWRSVVSFKGVLGGMSETNKTANGYYDSSIDYPFYIPAKTPYMETGVGIYNIFNFLRLDAVWRLNYLDHPNIQKFGVKMSFQFQF